MYLDELSTKEFKRRMNKNTVVILPVGIIEEHGAHLPLCTDSLQAEHVSELVAEKIKGYILPPVRYGVCSSTKNFPGSISLSFDTMRNLIYDILSELVRNNVRKIVVISGHAGRMHMSAIRLAAEKIAEEKNVKIIVLSDYELLYDEKGRKFLKRIGIPEWDAHGGAIETSRVMISRPDLIKLKGKKSLPKIPRYHILRNPEKYFPEGIIGDPSIASKEKGEKITNFVVNEIVKLIKEM
ncbi:MAG: creatininase family protein [Candidatus Thermoplasmatota archaeon]|nr:creatininase family protein [Candidatus Thermoplasmatota archaeon]